MELLKSEMLRWLEHEYRSSSAALTDDPIEAANYQASLMEGVIEPPEQPEPLQILRKLKRFDTQMWDGGYASQPHILLMELHTVIETELEHQQSLLANQFLRADHATKDPED